MHLSLIHILEQDHPILIQPAHIHLMELRQLRIPEYVIQPEETISAVSYTHLYYDISKDEYRPADVSVPDFTREYNLKDIVNMWDDVFDGLSFHGVIYNTEMCIRDRGYVERRNCLEGAFQVADSIVQYDHILIVDDIYTTGSTAESIGHEIAKKCPGRVYVLCICIGQGS